MDHAVLIPDRFEHIAVAPERCGRVDRLDGLEAKMLTTGEIGKFREEGQIQRTRDFVDFALMDLQHFDQELFCLLIAALEQFQADRLTAFAPLDGFYNLTEQVVRLFIDLQIGIAGDAERAARLNLIELKQRF